MDVPLVLALILNLLYVLFICEFNSAHIMVHVGIFVYFVRDFIALKAGVLMNCLGCGTITVRTFSKVF